MGTANEFEIEINNLNTKGYQTLIFKQKENVWEEETRELISIDI